VQKNGPAQSRDDPNCAVAAGNPGSAGWSSPRPTRALIGYQSELLTDTRGTAVFMKRLSMDYQALQGGYRWAYQRRSGCPTL